MILAGVLGDVRNIFIGFTGHADPGFNVEMLRRYDKFDTMLMPLHVADTAYLSFENTALPAAVEKGIGLLGMKIFGAGKLPEVGSSLGKSIREFKKAAEAPSEPPPLPRAEPGPPPPPPEKTENPESPAGKAS